MLTYTVATKIDVVPSLEKLPFTSDRRLIKMEKYNIIDETKLTNLWQNLQVNYLSTLNSLVFHFQTLPGGVTTMSLSYKLGNPMCQGELCMEKAFRKYF